MSACAACSDSGDDASSSLDRASPPATDATSMAGAAGDETDDQTAAPPRDSDDSASDAPADESESAAGVSDDAAPEDAAPEDAAQENGTQEDGAAEVPLETPEADVDGSDADGAADVPPPACEPALTEANKATVAAAIDELFVRGDITAVDRYWGEPYLQHNPIATSGVETFRNLFGGLISPGNPIYEMSRIVGDCELVLIHGDYVSFGGPTFDMFRVEGGRLVEHWDAAAVGAGPNESGHTALDGDAVVGDLEQGDENEARVLQFVDRVLIGADYEAVGEYVAPALIEHSPESSDGSDAYVQHLLDGSISYQRVHHAIGDGNFVFVLSEGAVGGTDVAHYDLFRVDASMIAEHWDGRRNVPASTQSGLGIF